MKPFGERSDARAGNAGEAKTTNTALCMPAARRNCIFEQRRNARRRRACPAASELRGACEAPRPEAGAGGNDLDGTTMRPAQTMKRSTTGKLQPNIERRTTPSFSDVRGPVGPGHERIGPAGRSEMCALATSMHVLTPAPARPRPGTSAQPDARPAASKASGGHRGETLFGDDRTASGIKGEVFRYIRAGPSRV